MKDKQYKQATVNEQRGTPYNPLVSIITPVLNNIKYLEICIQSVLNQDYPNIEHIIVDGGSTDGSLDILASFQAKYPDKIKFISGRDRGVGEAVNKGFSIAKGEIYGWIDADDVYESDAIQTVVEFFWANQEASFVYGNCDVINEKGEVIASFIIKDINLQQVLNDRHYIVFCAAFYRKQVIERVGLLNTLGNDLDFWIRVGKAFQMHRIEKTLTKWRLHSNSISLTKGAREEKIRKERFRQDFVISIRHGGSLFSPRSKRYYLHIMSPITEGLRPILGWLYPQIKKLLRV